MIETPTAEPTSAKVRKFPCPACGADVVWNPGASALKCPYCGAVKELPKSTDTIVEKPIEDALRAPRDLGWGMARKTVKCSKCGAVTNLDAGVAASSCAFCGTPSVVEAPPNQNMVRPEGLLPFAVDKRTAGSKFKSWVSSLWFRPNDLKHKAAVSDMQGVYVPFWMFDAATHSRWTAEAGYNYQVQVRVEENGEMVTKNELRTRWEDAEGVVEKFFDDLPIKASQGLERSLAEGIEPFPTANLIAYEPSYLSGFLAEEYAVGVEDALKVAKERMVAIIRADCSRAVPGDTQRNLNVWTQYSGVAYKNALLPIWIAAYAYGGKSYRFLVNGVTGKIDGKAPFSAIKITLAVLAALVVIYFLFLRR